MESVQKVVFSICNIFRRLFANLVKRTAPISCSLGVVKVFKGAMRLLDAESRGAGISLITTD